MIIISKLIKNQNLIVLRKLVLTFVKDIWVHEHEQRECTVHSRRLGVCIVSMKWNKAPFFFLDEKTKTEANQHVNIQQDTKEQANLIRITKAKSLCPMGHAKLLNF